MKQISLIIAFLFTTSVFSQVSPFVPVEWGQNAPYNDKCPLVGDSHALAGCVAVTMAQMMSAFRYPTSLAWDDIINGKSPEQIADLIYSAGTAAKTDYSLTNSSAQPTYQIRALVDNYGYDEDMIILSHSCVSNQGWEARIKAELDDGRPVMISARDGNYGGHSFIIDGYNDDGFHVNWGWAGKDNGYYSLDSLSPSKYNFSLDQRAFLGCKPDDGKQTVINYLEAECQLSDTILLASDAEDGKRITLNITVNNRTYRPFKGYYYIYYVSEDGTKTKSSKNKHYVLSPIEADFYMRDVIKLIPPTTPGTYHLFMSASQLLETNFSDMGLTGITSFTILPSSSGIEKTVIDADDINNGQYYNVAGQRIAKPTGKRLFKRTRQGSQLVI